MQKAKELAAAEAKADDINNRYLEEDKQLEEWAERVGAKRCVRCQFWVQKNDGCDHMTCRCGYEFCYICGGVYGSCQCHARGGNDYDDEDY